MTDDEASQVAVDDGSAKRRDRLEVTDPPESLSDPVRRVWVELVERHDNPSMLTGPEFETYCTLISTLREARDRVEREGMVVEDARGRLVPHPALDVERHTADKIRAFGDRFEAVVRPQRRRGYMADATAKSVRAAEKSGKVTEEHAGAIAALKTLAFLIDEAQRDGIETMQRASFGTIPTYLKACEALQLTPASLPQQKGTRTRPGGGGLATVRDATPKAS